MDIVYTDTHRLAVSLEKLSVKRVSKEKRSVKKVSQEKGVVRVEVTSGTSIGA